MTYREIVADVARENGLTQKYVDKVYKAYWQAVRMYVKSLPLKEDLTDEEFKKLRPNVNIPSLGKLNVTLDRYHRMKKFHRIATNLNKEENAEDL